MVAGEPGDLRLETRVPLFVMRHIAYVVLTGLTRTGLGLWCAPQPVDVDVSIMRRPVWWRACVRRDVRELEQALASASR
jgi:hypothetical protein